MTIHDEVTYEKLQYDINRKAVKYQHHHAKFINLNILLAKKYKSRSKLSNRTSQVYSHLLKE